MKLFTVLFFIFAPVLATDEYIEGILKLLDDPNFMINLEKRLQNDKSPVLKKTFLDNHAVKLASENSPQCKSRMFQKTIIRTEDSRKSGAKYLDSADTLLTNEECVQRCCKLDGCDLAVYENKTKHVCYMFKCHDDITGKSNCKFDSHADYIANTVAGKDVDGTAHTAAMPHPNSDLATNLEKVTQEMKPVHHPEPTPTPRPTQLPHLGTVCGPDSISCNIGEPAGVGPDCIPRTQKCDGTIQCADGSDENNCPELTVADKKLQGKSEPDLDGTYNNGDYGYDHQPSDSAHSQHLQAQLENSSQDYNLESNPDYDGGVQPAKQLTDRVNSAYSSEDKYDDDYRQNLSSDVDKEHVTVKFSGTDQPHVKPTFHPTKPVVSWYEESEGDSAGEPGTDGPERQEVSYPGRVDRVDDSGDVAVKATPVSSKYDPSIMRGRPEAVPRPKNKIKMEMTQKPFQPSVSSQTSESSPRGRLVEKPFQESQGNPRLNINPHSKDEYQQGFNPLYSSQGRRPLRPNLESDMSSTDYDGRFYGTRPLQQRPFKSGPKKGQFHKNQHATFDHPYMRGYNYDYNDYDPYNSYQGQDYNNRPYENHDTSSYPLNSFGGGYNNGDQKTDFNPSQGNRDQQLINSQEGSNSDHSPILDHVAKGRKMKLDKDTDSSHSLEKHTDTAINTDEVTTTTTSINDNIDDKHAATDRPENTDSHASKEATNVKEENTESPAPVPRNEIHNKPKMEHYPSTAEKDDTVFVTKKKVIVASFTDSAQGPIVALSLGLAFTFILLIFVGCRLRNVRRRLRKGRPLHQNEADYLINGMYL